MRRPGGRRTYLSANPSFLRLESGSEKEERGEISDRQLLDWTGGQDEEWIPFGKEDR